MPAKKSRAEISKQYPDIRSVARMVIEFLRKFTGLFGGRLQKAPKMESIMPPWILPRPERRTGRIIATLAPFRQVPKLRKKDIRKVIKGRSKPTTIIIMEDC